jgi:PAS domain S-box-containing protein
MTPPAGLKYYALAVGASTVAIALKVALGTRIASTYILGYPAVMLTAMLGGLGPGLLATAMTATMAGFGSPGLQEAPSLVLFVGMGVFMSIVAERYRHASLRVELLGSERALWASEKKYRELFETMPFGVVYQDGQGAILSANHAAGRILGLSLDQMQGRTSLDPRWKTIHPDGSDFPGSEHPAMVALRTGKEVRGEVMGVFNPVLGAHTWISVDAVRQQAPVKPTEAAVFTTFEDITRQTLGEITLRDTEERLRRFFESAQEMIVLHQLVTDAAGRPLDYRIVDCNPTFTAITGITRERAVGALASVLYGTPQAPYLDTYAAVVQSGESHTFETYFAPMEKHFRVSAFSTGRGCFATSSHDITSLKQAEARLLASKEELHVQKARLDAAALSGKLGLWDLDLITGTAWRTPQHDRLFGYDEVQPTWGYEMWRRHVTPADWAVLQRAFEEAHVAGHLRCEVRIDPAGGPQRWVAVDGELFRDETGKPVRMMGTVKDVTEARNLQAQFAQAARLTAMGTLVAGVAHEINNPLAGELANQALALEVVQDVRDRLRGNAPLDREAAGRSLDDVLEALKDAETGGRRIARIVKDLTTFGRPDPRRTPVRLMDVVDESMRWLHATVVQTATVRVENLSPPDVIASAGQIEQVLVNLVTNAAKATPDGKRGEIVVRLGPGSPGMARLEVIDQGTGMEPALMDRIFDPFFTTRPIGQGSGLGLAISHAIVTAHGGTLTVESEVGKGSTFRMELPAAPAET